jgi:hypothetical protein
MSHGNTYDEGGCATANEHMKDSLRDAHWEYTENGGTLSYDEWLADSEEARKIRAHYQPSGR